MRKKSRKIFSDFIDESFEAENDLCFGSKTKIGKYGLEKYEFEVDSPILAKKLCKKMGHYTTINCKFLYSGLSGVDEYVCDELTKSLRLFLKKVTSKKSPLVLVVGLGNNGIVSDSLGTKVTEKIFATTCLPSVLKKGLGKLCYINAGVGGQTGITSFDIIKSVTEIVKPDVIIAVDALCTISAKRLGLSFQISNSGISPGAGVKNNLKALNKETLGVEVIAIGVPMMISGSGLCEQIDDSIADKIFAPKDVDIQIEKCSSLIGKAINKLVHKKNIKLI